MVVLFGTHEGDKRVRTYLEETMSNADLEICEALHNEHVAFGSAVGFWSGDQERAEAHTLLTNLGVRVTKRRPLGFEDQGLLLTFSRNCPNNSLPILYGVGKGRTLWKPLFPRYNV